MTYTPQEDNEFARRQRARKKARLRKLKRRRAMLIAAMVLLLLLLIWGAAALVRALFFKKPVDPASITVPDWVDVQLLDVNPYSRPGTPLEKINDIKKKNKKNNKTTAQKNRNYLNSLEE